LRRPTGIVAALPLTGLLPKAAVRQHPGAAKEWRPVPLPAGLVFLTAYGVRPALLLLAAVEARRQAITPEAALLASGSIGDSFYYRFAAPQGRLLAHLLARARGGERFGARLAITTPSHLSRLVRAATIASILREATLGLANLDPSLSAKAGPSQAQCAFAMTAIAVSTFAFGLTPAFALAGVSLSMTCFFLASIWLRLFAGAASTACGQEPFRARVEDRRLPVYSVVAALHREARVVPQLAAALDAIDYPGIMAQPPQA